MSSAAKAELGALYINAREAIPMQLLLKKQATSNRPHPSKLTTAQHTGWSPTTFNHDAPMWWTWDSTGYVAKTPKAIPILLAPRTQQKAGYWAKHHCTAHHIEKCPTILTSKFILVALRASTQHTPATTGKGLMKFELTASWGSLTLSCCCTQKSFVINVCLVNLLVKLARRK